MICWHLQENTEARTRLAGAHRLHSGQRVLLKIVETVDGTPRATEGLWLRITQQLGNAEFVGYPISSPRELQSVTTSTDIVFGPGDVFEVDSEPLAIPGRPADAMAIVSLRLAVGERTWAKCACRVEPAGPLDSGWRFANTPEEDPASLAPGRNGSVVVPLSRLLRRDASLHQLLPAPTGRYYERDHPGDPWVAVRRAPCA